jgi:hypothetical protein
MPFYTDGTSISGVKLDSTDAAGTKTAAAIASLSKQLGRMTLHALNLH